ncbi:MAG TPA: SOS response-associated peptidase family protein [Pyrinomonadaceae bacterium]|jgi:putative SOS response-associated peptidase YedK|nr:SOS response-associated peptidase family protein [Pyrinomonadaceae bacterium]
MCGRASQEEIDEYFHYFYGWEMPEGAFPKRNIRPTQRTNIIAHHPGGEVKTVRANWWCQWDGSLKFDTKYPMFNIRVDTMDDKKTWSTLLKKGKRCVFPIDAFYEWPVKGKGLPPVKIMTDSRKPYGIAGLWSTWYDEGVEKYSFATFTVEPNDFMYPIHPKAMPVILDSIEAQKLWLLEGDRELLTPYGGEMVADQMADTLEKLYPEENPPPKSKATPEPAPPADSGGSLFG